MAKLHVTLNQEYFGVQPNVPLMHQVVTAQLAKRRAGTQSTKTRSEVRGGGAKPFRQKGTGRARQGSTNAPHYAGGGVALGPKPRSYAQRTPKKMIKLALRSALSDRAADDRVLVVDAFGWAEPSTKQAVKALGHLGVDGRTLVVLEREDAIAALSFRNLPDVQLINVGELNAYDVLCNDWIVFTAGSLSALTDRDGAAAFTVDAQPADEVDEMSVEASAAESTGDDEAPTASTPERSDDEATTGVGSASDDLTTQPDASDSEPAGTARSELPAQPEASGEPQPEANEASQSSGGVVAPADGSQPEGYPIKGNADSMRYHLPNGQWYAQTVAEYWFDSEESARAAGYTLAGSSSPAMTEDASSEADTEPSDSATKESDS